MRLRRFFIGIAVLCLVALAAAWLLLKYAPEVTLNFTQVQLQSQLSGDMKN
jgi:uncharacterized membrane protein